MKRQLLTKIMLLLCALVAGSTSVWADPSTYTLTLSSSTKFAASGLTSGGVTWSVSVPSGGATIGSYQSGYTGQQFGTSKTQGSVTFSTSSITGTITSIVVSSQTGTEGSATVAVSVGGTSWGSQGMQVATAGTGSTPGDLEFTGSKTGEIQITLTQTAKKAMYLNKIVITYTPSSTPSSGVSFATENPSIDWPTNLTYTQTATTATGYAGTAGASVTYSIGSTNTCAATIDSETGEVTPTKGGSVQVIATAAAIDGQFTQSTASYTLTVTDVRETATLSWSGSSVEIIKDAASYSLPTLSNPNSLDVTYEATGTDGLASVTSSGVVTVNTGTVGTATIKAIFAGNSTYKPRTVSYTISVVDPTAKGGKYNPYTVAEVIAMAPSSTSSPAAGQSDIYITGYIVGEYQTPNETTTTVKQSSFTTDANIAIADDPSTTALASSVPVNLTKNADKTAFGNSTNNGKTIGYKVLVKADVLKYFGMPGVKNVDEISVVTIPLAPAKTYTTLTSKYALDFTSVNSDLEAYIATTISAGSVKMTQVNKVPAGTGLVLKATTPGTTVNVPVFDGTEAADVSANKMAGSATTTTAIAANGGYILKDGVFQPASEGTLPAGKAYLNISAGAGAPSLSLFFGDETTGINSVKREEIRDKCYFNLAGQRVAQPSKGLYIVNGRKVVIK